MAAIHTSVGRKLVTPSCLVYNMFMAMVIGVIALIFAAALALGWIVPLAIGITRIRKGTAGTALTVIGAAWGVLALSVCGLAFYGYRQVAGYSEVEDFDHTQYQGETGSIVVPYHGESSLVVADTESDKQIRLSTTDGTLIVPAGTYELFSYDVADEDENGTKWKASCYLFQLKSDKISVEPGSRQKLDIGPPFTAKVAAKSKGQGEVSFDMTLTGRDGCQYTISRAGESRKAPTFHVLGKSGNVLWKGSFTYG